ncbi:MAG TPA: hypothetical protein VFP36_11935 [Usitatibacter sp.]|nr:hypothetical protein [Usitatibacter sp.]
MAACLAAWPAAALLTRPDRDDAEYLELASRYTSSIALGASAGEAVLVAPRWLLTGARQAEALRGAAAIAVDGARHEIQSIQVDPSRTLALVFLRTPLEGIEPSPPYRDKDEDGKTVVFVGHGRGGRLGEAAPTLAPVARAGINTIDRVAPRTLSLKLKGADEASDLQAALTAEELGAPAFIEVKQRPMVAGIAIDAGREWQGFARVSSFADWIDDTMFAAGVAEAKSGTYPGFPDSGKPRR